MKRIIYYFYIHHLLDSALYDFDYVVSNESSEFLREDMLCIFVSLYMYALLKKTSSLETIQVCFSRRICK